MTNDRDQLSELYGDLCTVIERTLQGWPLDDPDDPFGHTSDPARAAATRIVELVDAYLGTDLLGELDRSVEEQMRNNPALTQSYADFLAKNPPKTDGFRSSTGHLPPVSSLVSAASFTKMAGPTRSGRPSAARAGWRSSGRGGGTGGVPVSVPSRGCSFRSVSPTAWLVPIGASWTRSRRSSRSRSRTNPLRCSKWSTPSRTTRGYDDCS